MTNGGAIKIKLGEPLRFRVETTMRKALKAYAKALSDAVGHNVGLGGAVRDLVARGLGTGSDAAYLSGFREGFIAAFADTRKQLAVRADRAAGKPDGSPIGPRPRHDKDDYQGGGE